MAFDRNKPFNVLQSMQATGLHIATIAKAVEKRK
jgi:hypothetical protein